MTEECQCAIHTREKRWKELLQIDSAEKYEAFYEILDCLYEAEMDAEYRKSVLNGEWPNSKLILEKSLAKINSKES